MTLKNQARRDHSDPSLARDPLRERRRRGARLLVAAVAVLAAAGLSTTGARRAEADAPPCRYKLTADTATDKETGLMWQRNTLSSYGFDGAKAHCEGLSIGGFTGWRLPTLQELLTLIDESQTKEPAIDSAAFTDTPPIGFWSSTVYAADPAQVWYVSFYGGLTSLGSKNGSYLVRCVR